MSSLILGWLANHWLLIAALVVGIAAIAQPVIVWKFKAWILLAVVLWWGWTGHAATNALRAKLDGQALQYAKEAAAASERARDTERRKARDIAAIAAQHEQDKTDAKAKHDRVVADLRSGAERLRDHWTCPAAVPGTAAGSGQRDEGAELRAESSGRIIAAAAEADAQVRAAQAVIEADRK